MWGLSNKSKLHTQNWSKNKKKKTLGVRINQKKSNVFHEKGDHDGKFPMDRRVKFSIAKEKHTIMENAQM